MGRNGSDSRFMHEMALWAQAVGGSLRDLRRRREMGFRGDKFSAREPDYYEAHGYAPVGYSAKKARLKEPRNPGFPSSRKTALAVVAIVIGATVPAFTIVSMLNPSDPETYHGAAGEYAAQRALDTADAALDDPAAAGLAADDPTLGTYLASEEYKDQVADRVDALPEVSTEGDQAAAGAPSAEVPATGPQVQGPMVPAVPVPSAVAPPVSAPAAPAAPAPSVSAPQTQRAPQQKPAAPARTERAKAPRVSVPTQPSKPTQAEKPAKPNRSERGERQERKEEAKARTPKSERGGKTLIDHGTEPAAPEKSKTPTAPEKSKSPKTPKAPENPAAPEQPQAPVAPDQPSVSVDPADPASNPAADEDAPVTTAPEAHTEPPTTDTERATSQDDRRVTPRSIKKEPRVTTESEDPRGR